MTQMLRRLWPEEKGENISEYGLLLLLGSLLALAGMRGLAAGVNRAYAKASTQVITSGGGTDSITTDPIGDVDTSRVGRPATAPPTEAPSDASVRTRVKTRGIKSRM